jgi:hypothetical protein
MATEQAAYGLVSLYRSLTGASSLYNMSDVSLSVWMGPDSGKVPVLISAAPDYAGAGTAVFYIDAPLYDFIDLSLGGISVDRSAYTLSLGSTIITFNEAYLKSLAPGTYTFKASFKGGDVDIVLKVLEPSAEGNNTVSSDGSTNNYYSSGGSAGSARLRGKTSGDSAGAGSASNASNASSNKVGSPGSGQSQKLETDTGDTASKEGNEASLAASADDILIRVVLGVICALIAVGLAVFLIIRLRTRKKGELDV